MTAIETFLLLGAGYVSGLSVFSGFVMRWILFWFVKDKAAWRHVLWSAWMFVNTVTASIITVLLVAVLVIGDQPGREDFWPRFALYAAGLVVGMTFVLGSMWVFDKTATVARKQAA